MADLSVLKVFDQRPDPALGVVPTLHAPPRGVGSKPRIQLAALRVPLVVKLVGANLGVVVLLVAAWLMAGGAISGIAVAGICAVIGLHVALVFVALRPIRDLEAVASRVWYGDFGARVERSSVADDGVLRVGSMFNILLDGLASDRTRMRALATDVIAAGDRERAALARELHDSTAQRIAALLLHLSAAARDATDPGLAERLRDARNATEGILEEVRVLSHHVHPRVLDDLGLGAALRKLARDVSLATDINIEVNTDGAPSRLPPRVEVAFYRVAQEAVRNASRHGSPTQLRINLYAQHPSVTLEVHDDGRGFYLAEADRRGVGTGLLSMRERVALVGGSLDIRTAQGSGTTVSATVPFDAAIDGVCS